MANYNWGWLASDKVPQLLAACHHPRPATHTKQCNPDTGTNTDVEFTGWRTFYEPTSNINREKVTTKNQRLLISVALKPRNGLNSKSHLLTLFSAITLYIEAIRSGAERIASSSSSSCGNQRGAAMKCLDTTVKSKQNWNEKCRWLTINKNTKHPEMFLSDNMRAIFVVKDVKNGSWQPLASRIFLGIKRAVAAVHPTIVALLYDN